MNVGQLGKLFQSKLLLEAKDIELKDASPEFQRAIDELTIAVDSHFRIVPTRYTQNYVDSPVLDGLSGQRARFTIPQLCEIGALDLLEYMIDNGTRIDVDNCFRTAAIHSQTHILDYLAKKANMTEDQINIAIYNISEYDPLESLLWVMKHYDMPINVTSMRLVIKPLCHDLDAVLHMLFTYNCVKIVHWIMANTNISELPVDDNVWVTGYLPMIRIMEELKMNINYNDCLNSACMVNRMAVIDALIVEHNDLDWDTAFKYAAGKGSIAAMGRLKHLVNKDKIRELYQKSDIRVQRWLEEHFPELKSKNDSPTPI